MEPTLGDAFGNALLDRLDGRHRALVIERDDGSVEVDTTDYFRPADHDQVWAWLRSRLGRRVLDLGAGAGCGSLAAQAYGLDVVALDVSPGCAEVCRRRGVRHVFEGTLTDLAATGPEPFDTILAIGNNLGLIGSPAAAGAFFDAARQVGTSDVRLIGTMLDPHRTTAPLHLAYHDRNRAAGRPAGQIRLRVRHADIATDWVDLLWLSTDELAALAGSHGWTLVDTDDIGPCFAAELRPA